MSSSLSQLRRDMYLLPHGWVDEGVVALGHEVPEVPLEDGPGDAGHGVVSLLHVLPLRHQLRAHPDLRLREVLVQLVGVHACRLKGGNLVEGFEAE